MAVDEIAQLGVARDPRDAEGGGQVVGLEFALKATLELQQRTVLDVKCCVAGYVAFDRYLLVE